MSTVYRAEDLTLGRKVALKLMSERLSADPAFRERFRAEWRLAASIDHPNVIPIYEAGEADGQLFIAMRFVEGTDLKALLDEEGALDPQRALGLVAQAAAGLDAAHDRGLVHRDVKPSNVLISFDRDGEHAYLADFGLTKPADTAEGARESIQLSGTFQYVSPEQIVDGTADRRSDVYALGALLYECLTGEVPYRRASELQALYAHVNEPPPRPTAAKPDLPEAIDEVIATAMAKAPEDRHPSGAELAEAGSAAFPEHRRPRWHVAALVAVLALLIAAAVAIPAILLTGGGEVAPGGTTEITTDSVQRIDPDAGELAATVPLTASPDLMDVGEGSVWIIDKSERILTELDTGSNEVVNEVSHAAVESTPDSIFVGEGADWVNYDPENAASTLAKKIWLYDPSEGFFAPWPQSGVAIDRIDGVGHGSLWGALSREAGSFDTPTKRVSLDAAGEATEIDADSNFHRLAFSEADAWAYDIDPDPPYRTLVWRIDPDTNETTQVDVPALPVIPDGTAADEHGLWVPDPAGNALYRVDRDTMETEQVATLRFPEKPAVAGGFVWVTNSRDGIVYRVNPETLDVESIEVGGTPIDIAADEDGVWVTVSPPR